MAAAEIEHGTLEDEDDVDLKANHRGIPTWDEAIGMIVGANMEARARNPNGPSSRAVAVATIAGVRTVGRSGRNPQVASGRTVGEAVPGSGPVFAGRRVRRRGACGLGRRRENIAHCGDSQGNNARILALESMPAPAQAAKELGDVEVIWKGPLQESDREGQISLVQDFVTRRVDGIVLAPLDSQALRGAGAHAKAEGIPTVIFDRPLADENDIVSYVATDNYRCGQLAAQKMDNCSSGHGRVILLRYNPGSESTEQREQGFLDALAKEFPNVEILSSTQYSGTSFEDALSVSQQLMLKFGEQVDGVFTVCEPNSTGMLGALHGT